MKLSQRPFAESACPETQYDCGSVDHAAFLKVVEGDGIGRTLRLGPAHVTIGRCTACGFLIQDHSTSRVHCVAWRDSRGPLIRDMFSTNGTLVNGEPVRSARLVVGDLVRIGDTVLIVTADSDGADDRSFDRSGNA
jgi:pSer/pThr/pTyr-binding forkhead associated (FHA) protein